MSALASGRHTGKNQATYDKRDALFADFRTSITLPSLKHSFGHGNDYKGDHWLMLGNGPDDTVAPGFSGCGDCAWAGPAHEHMAMAANTGKPAPQFSGATIVKQYGEYCGYNPQTGENDNGSNIREVLAWRQSKGLLDDNGTAHKIGPYVALEPKNLQQLYEAIYLFDGCVGIGIEFPDSADDQFGSDKIWTPVAGAQIVGGHYINGIGRMAPGVVTFITWAKRTEMTQSFFETYNDEVWAYVSPEAIAAKTGKTYEGFNAEQLDQYLQVVVQEKANA